MAVVSPLTDPQTINEAIRHDTAMAFKGCDPYAEQRWRDAAADRAGRGRAALAEWQAERAPRLVKARKSPTEGSAGRFLFDVGRVQRASDLPPAPSVIDTPGAWAPDCQGPGRFAVLESRQWAGEYRIRTEVDPGNLAPPEPQRGTRWTEMLTHRGARKIADSCYYVAKKRGGYTTFLTLTLDEAARERLARRLLEPVGTLDNGMLVQPGNPEPAKDRKGQLGPVPRAQGDTLRVYDPEDPENWELIESKGESVAGNTTYAGPHTLIDPETCRPYNPVKPDWEWSLQKEASRFFDGLTRMYKRGWQYQRAVRARNDRKTSKTSEGAAYTPIRWETVRVPGSTALYCVEGETVDGRNGAPYTRLSWWREPLDYLWVTEAPHRKDDQGNPMADPETGEMLTNPHLHVMIRWRVPYRHFHAWAGRVEKLWGQGMAHLEKIKEPEKAGAYVAKAAGYLCKAQGNSENNQGTIRGNRYGISKRARAPEWTEEERYQLGVMGWLLAEAAEKWEEHHGEKVQRRERLKWQLERADTRDQRRRIGKLLENVRGELETLPRVNKYQALLKGDDQLEKFMAWARRQGFSEKPGTGQWLTQWRENQWHRRNDSRLKATADEVARWLDIAESGAVALDESDLADWGLYADLGMVHVPGLQAAGV